MQLALIAPVGNANRLRRWHPPRLSAAQPRQVDPVVEAADERPPAEPTVALDPVCGMQVDPASAAATATHDGQTYHFCSTGCRDRFTDDPGRVLAHAGHHTHGGH